MNEENQTPNVLTEAERTYNEIMGWKGITYVVVFCYIVLAAHNIYKNIKR